MNRAKWNAIAPHFVGGTALPVYGPLAPTEDELHLLPPIAGTHVLELGCGSGHSLLYLAERGAAEVWGLDLSATQIELAQQLLNEYHHPARLFQAPMETNPGLPTNHFDVVLSIYGLGWTTDLAQTLSLVASYLKPGGIFIFSWEHPFYRCVASVEGRMEMQCSYHVEGPMLDCNWFGDAPVTKHARKVSTFVNDLLVLEAGMTIERMIETELDTSRSKPAHEDPDRWYSIPRARWIPTTLIVRAHKPR
jgi:SAM-dependent methyltransferase